MASVDLRDRSGPQRAVRAVSWDALCIQQNRNYMESAIELHLMTALAVEGGDGVRARARARTDRYPCGPVGHTHRQATHARTMATATATATAAAAASVRARWYVHVRGVFAGATVGVAAFVGERRRVERGTWGGTTCDRCGTCDATTQPRATCNGRGGERRARERESERTRERDQRTSAPGLQPEKAASAVCSHTRRCCTRDSPAGHRHARNGSCARRAGGGCAEVQHVVITR